MLLLSRLRRSEAAAISAAEVRAAGGDIGKLLAAGLLQRLDPNLLRAPGCERCCTPNWDWDSRRREGLVGVACPNEPACWSGFEWLRREELGEYRVDPRGVMVLLQASSRFEEITIELPRPFLPVGRAERRGKMLAVLWARRLTRTLEAAVLGLQPQLDSDWLVVVTGRRAAPRLIRPGVAVLELPRVSEGALDLTPALDLLDPGYRERAVGDPDLDLDFANLVFATDPGEPRHVLRINGHEVGAFQRSDVRFLRLLVLAAGRAAQRTLGWRLRAVLVGDLGRRPAARSTKSANDALDSLRKALRETDVPGLSEEERAALVKTQTGNTGKIRLAVPPENIVFDPSLASLAWAGPGTTTRRDGRPGRMSKKQREGLESARLLLRACRDLGVPGDPNDLPAIPPP